MSWKEVSVMSQRAELVSLALAEGANVSALCVRFGVSRKTADKWIGRCRAAAVTSGVAAGLGDQGDVFADRSRRPLEPAGRTVAAMEERVRGGRGAHPAWGGRKPRRRLSDPGHAGVPAASTVTEILRRHGLLDSAAGAGVPRDFPRFEHPQPNDLWRMDFKGHFGLTSAGRCHPLTVLDDHSRYSLGLRACGNEQGETVRSELRSIFRVYGLPRRMLMDNGPPWGDTGQQPRTQFTAGLVRLGIGVSHGRPYHPQTPGKEERFHRTLKAEVLRDRRFRDLADCQRRFDPWRLSDNTERPHDALALAVPASRYRPRGRVFAESLPVVEYAADVPVRKTQANGEIDFRGQRVPVGGAFAREPVGLRATLTDGVWEALYCRQCLGTLDLREVVSGDHRALSLKRVLREVT